jgi:hypothetical protein
MLTLFCWPILRCWRRVVCAEQAGCNFAIIAAEWEASGYIPPNFLQDYLLVPGGDILTIKLRNN